MTYLPDVNVWVAAIIAEHTLHASARAWFESVDNDIAFCRVTQMALLRLLTNVHVMAGDAMTAGQAWRVLDRLHRDERIVFASEPAGLERAWRGLTPAGRTGPNFWTDAYLAAFVEAAACTLVTFDRGFRAYKSAHVRILTP